MTRWGLLVTGLLVVSTVACTPSSPRFDGAPLVLISIDTLRADRLPAYGYDGTATPHLDGLIADGVLFERAYAPVPLTLPSHVSMMTGRLPHRHGVRSNAGYPFDPEASVYLPRLLRDADYRLGGFVSAYPLSRAAGFGDGFDAFDDHDGFARQIAAGIRLQRPGSETLAAARQWLASLPSRDTVPFGLFVHFFEPHAPYEPPAYFAKGVRHPYDGEVQAADHLVGLLLDDLRQAGLYDRALIVVFSDHGEGLGDHGENEHGMLLYRETLQVPLIVKLPGALHAGERVAPPVGLIDLLPTLAQWLNLPIESDPAYAMDRIDGRSLAPLLAGDTDEPAVFESRPLLAETVYPRMEMGWSELQSAIRGPHHYVHGPAPELFDLIADPRERDDLLDRERRTAGELRQVIREAGMAYTPPEAVSAEAEAALASLGYVGAAGATETLVDPRDKIGVYEDFRRGRQAWLDRDPEAAAAYLRGAVSADPELTDAWKLLSIALERLGQTDEAAAARARVEALERDRGN
ncbi:MAG: sulfatase [Acidobacteriota bacterium]